MRKIRLAGSLLCLLLVSVSGAWSAPRERILDFESWIDISAEGTLRVIETIRVYAAGETIKRGIYREFPTRYPTRDGRTVRMDFRVLSVERDGRPEPFHLKDTADGQRVYMGKADVFLPPGEHTYALTYATDRQLGFFENFDELYWNVTGNDWQFFIEHARAVVAIPGGADILQTAAYTGRRGQQGRDFTVGVNELGQPVFSTTRTLMPGEGLTVAVAWPKGFVREPSTTERIGFLVRDQAGFFTGLVALGIVFAYYFLVWIRVGKDPERGIIIARFYPPEKLSPAAVRYIANMGYDNKAFAAAVVDMAVKGAIEISRADDGEFTLKKTKIGLSSLSRGERQVFNALLGSREQITLERSRHKILSKAVSALKSALAGEFEKVMFTRNAGYLVPGAILTVVGLGAVILTAPDAYPAAFITVWLTIWSFGCTALGLRVIGTWREAARRRKQGGALLTAGAVMMTLFAIPFFAGWVIGFTMFVHSLSIAAGISILAMILLNLLFYHLLKAPTLDGQRIRDDIEGFARYLSVAEKERLKMLNPPEKTPQLFQKYLPYAMALDVEAPWSEQFASILAQMQSSPSAQPSWFRGASGLPTNWNDIASDLGGSLSSAISSAATAPGSSSGSGGGGSSGGGGGGGGGGGW